MACPPAYDPTDSPDGTSLNADPTTHRWPAAYLPSYSTVTPLDWWEEAALEVLRTSHDFDDIKLVIKFTPGLDSITVATLLSSRSKDWLDAFWRVFYRDEAVDKPSGSLLSTAEAIMAAIRRRSLSPAIQWNGDWIFSDLLSSLDIASVAEKLDAQIHSTFCTFVFEDWVAWCYGYRNDAISNFLNTIFNFRNKLAQHAQQHGALADGLLSLQKTLRSQQPLPCWIVLTAISFDTSSSPYEALGFFLDPIYQLFNKQSSGIIPIVQKLSILCARFELKVIYETDVNWPKPFSTNFSFWENVQRDSSEYLAKSNTESVRNLYFDVSSKDLLCHSEYMKDIGWQWSELVDEIEACLNADGKLTSYFMDFAEYLLHRLNVHSAAAVGLALSKYGFQPRKQSQKLVWDIINPEDNFAGCRKFMAKEACLPFIFLLLVDLRKSGNAADKLVAILSMLGGYFGETKGVEGGQGVVGEEKTGREGTIVSRYLPCEIEHLSSLLPVGNSCMFDLYGELQPDAFLQKFVRLDECTQDEKQHNSPVLRISRKRRLAVDRGSQDADEAGRERRGKKRREAKAASLEGNKRIAERVCYRCKIRKRKCSKELPSCSDCTKLLLECNYDYGPPPDVIRVVSPTIEPSIVPTGLIESAPSRMLGSIENGGTLEIKGKKSAEGPGRTYDILSILNPDRPEDKLW